MKHLDWKIAVTLCSFLPYVVCSLLFLCFFPLCFMLFLSFLVLLSMILTVFCQNTLPFAPLFYFCCLNTSLLSFYLDTFLAIIHILLMGTGCNWQYNTLQMMGTSGTKSSSLTTKQCKHTKLRSLTRGES